MCRSSDFYHLTEVSDEKRKEIEGRMKGAGFDFKIVQIEQIENKQLKEAYDHSKEETAAKRGDASEKWLFRGTQEHSSETICKRGFGTVTKEKGGNLQGVFYAVHAKHANKYAHVTTKQKEEKIIPKTLEDDMKGQASNVEQMFWAQVITGNAYPYSRESDSSDSTVYIDDERYDSAHKDAGNEKETFIVSKPDRAYPAYLITYECFDAASP